MNPPIPRFACMRPFEQIPFQFSIHSSETLNGAITHREYLCTRGKAPRGELAGVMLEALQGDGSIVHYTSFEKTVIRNLAGCLPDLSAPLLALLERCVYLKEIVKTNIFTRTLVDNFHKDVLPILVSELSYQGLDISDGMTAADWRYSTIAVGSVLSHLTSGINFTRNKGDTF